MSEGATIQWEVQRRTATSVISDLQEEVALWKSRAARAEQLLKENEKLRAKCAALEQKVAALEQKVKEQQEEIARLQREGKRSAGPFARRKRKDVRNKPGRKKGEGRFKGLVEAPASPDTTQVDVPTPDKCDCGGSLEFLRYEEASNTDPPQEVHPRVTKFRVPVCRCRRCGATVRGTHPDLAPEQQGATAHRYGDRMMALGHILHYGMGVPQRKIPDIMEIFLGVRPTQSTFNQDATRRSEEDLKPDYKALRDSMKKHPVGHTDATGWRVDGEAAQMAVYANSEATVYEIQKHYRNDEIRQVFPGDYKGTLVTDGAKAFDADALSNVKQQKCIFHGLKLIGEALEKQKGQEREFGERLKGMLQEGLALWHSYHDGKKRGYREKAAELDQQITEHLQERTRRNADNQRLLKFFGGHHRKGSLTRFLYQPKVPPTNNLGELELRYVIGARKVSQCSKNERGANARKVLSSLLRTEKRQLEKERRLSQKPYADQQSFQAEQRKELASKADPPLVPSTLPRSWLDRVTDLLREARLRWQEAQAAVKRWWMASPVASP
jgi:transposase